MLEDRIRRPQAGPGTWQLRPDRVRGGAPGPAPLQVGTGTDGDRRRSPRRCRPCGRRRRCRPPRACPCRVRRRGRSWGSPARPPHRRTASSRPRSVAPALLMAPASMSGGQSCRNVSTRSSGRTPNVPLTGSTSRNGAGHIVAELRKALSDLRQVTRHEHEVAEQTDSGGRLSGDDSPIAVRDHDGRLVAVVEYLPHRRATSWGSPGPPAPPGRPPSPQLGGWGAKLGPPAPGAGPQSGATTTHHHARTLRARIRPSSPPLAAPPETRRYRRCRPHRPTGAEPLVLRAPTRPGTRAGPTVGNTHEPVSRSRATISG